MRSVTQISIATARVSAALHAAVCRRAPVLAIATLQAAAIAIPGTLAAIAAVRAVVTGSV